MMTSISRYCEPVFLGIILFIVLGFLSYPKLKVHIAVCFSVILLMDFTSTCHGLYTYRDDLSQICSDRESAIEASYRYFDCIEKLGNNEQCKILFVADEDSSVLQEQRIIRYLSAPKAVYYDFLNADTDVNSLARDILKYASNGEYDYFYVQSSTDVAQKLNIENSFLYSGTDIVNAVKE